MTTQTHWALVVVLALLAALGVFLPQGNTTSTLPDQDLPASRP